MNKRKKILKCIIFLIIGIFIFQILTYIFVPKLLEQIDPATARIKGFYDEKTNTIDVLFIGNSETARGFSPIAMWNQYGITSYNYGSSLQIIQIAYYKVKEALKYQTPKVIVLEANSFFDTEDIEEHGYRRVLDNFKLDDVKLNAIFDDNIKLNDRLSYIFPLLRYHSRWNQLEANDFKKSLKEEYQSVSYKGVPMIISKKAYTGDKKYMKEKGEIAKIPEKNLPYIDRIIKICQDKNIKLVMTELPTPFGYWSLAKSNATKEFANRNGIEFIDFNLLQEEIKIDWENDTYDGGGHLNIYGAEKVSEYMGKVLSEQYNIENHKEDKDIAFDWNETAKRYKENKEKLENNDSNK